MENLLHGPRSNPTRQLFEREDNPYHPSGDDAGAAVFPYVLTTYRLTEHHTAGAMSRTVPHLSELMPELFCEVSPGLAAERGLEHGGWATIVSARTAVEARVLVTERMKPIELGSPPTRRVEQVGLPYHFGRRGIVTGDAGNELLPLVLDRNVHISEFKTATCDIVPGRRPRGAALAPFVAEYRRRAGL
jgi:formate dehydrogenase major subunit